MIKNHWLTQIHTFCIKNKEKLILLAIFLFVLCVYSYGLLWLPPEYDEVLISNAALNCPSNTFIEHVIWVKGQCVPIMLSSYIGGFMALPYKIFFLVAEPSVLSFRILNVVMLLVSFGLIYFAVKKYFSKSVALMTVLLLSLDFQLFYNIRIERTMIVPFILKSLVLFFASLYLERRQRVYVLLTVFLVGLSIWTKFDALFFYLALSVAFVLSKKWRVHTVKSFLSDFSVLIAALAVGLLPLLFYLRYSWQRFIFIGKEVAGGSFSDLFVLKAKHLLFQFISYDAVGYIFRNGYSYGFVEITLSVLILIALVIAGIHAHRNRKAKFLILTVIVFYLFYFLYGGLKFSHHRTLIYPFPHILLAVYVIEAKNKWTKLTPILFAVAFFVAQSHFYSKIKTQQQDVSFTSEIYSLAQYTSGLDGNILVGDWGVTNQLLLLSHNPSNYSEVAFAANTATMEAFSDSSKLQISECDYLVLHSTDTAIFKNADRNLRTAVDGKLVYTDRVFEVYSCESK